MISRRLQTVALALLTLLLAATAGRAQAVRGVPPAPSLPGPGGAEGSVFEKPAPPLQDAIAQQRHTDGPPPWRGDGPVSWLPVPHAMPAHGEAHPGVPRPTRPAPARSRLHVLHCSWLT